MFFYYSDVRKRAKKLFMDFNGSKRWMYNDGFIDEYLSYDIPEEQEILWKKEMGKK
jgi:hypothetical protein